MKKRLLIVPGIGLVILLAGSALYRFRSQALSSHSTIPDAKTAAVWHAQDVPVWNLVRGQELVYDLRYRGSGKLPGQQEQALAFQLQGTLEILVLAEDSDFYRVWIHVKPEGQAQLMSLPAPMRSVLQKTWTEGVAARLALRGFHWEPILGADMDPTAAHFWRSLAERMQVNVPSLLDAPTWSQEETIAGDRTRARYEIDSTLLTPALRGEKIYLRKSFETAQLSGESLVLLQPHFEGLEKLDMQVRETLTDSSLHIQWQRQNQQDESRLAVLDTRWGKSRSDNRGQSSQETMIQKVALGSLGFDEIWNLMTQSGSQNSQELYLKLKAWIYLHPDEVQKLVDRLKGLDEGDPALKLGIRALAAAGQPEAQDALVDLLDQRKTDVPLARKIITTLGLVPAPTLKAQAALEALSQANEDSPVRRSSRLALGIMGQRLSQNPDADSQKRAENLEAQALANLRRASGLAQITEALAVLGNCGLTRIEDLDPWLKHADPAIRGPAFFALRFARPEVTPDYLVNQYPGEVAAAVQRQILQALSLRTPDNIWFRAVENLLKNPLPDTEKIVLAKTLAGTVRKHREESLKILGELLLHTDDPVVRETLARYQDTAKSQVAL